MALHTPDEYTNVLFGRTTLAVFVFVGAAVALAEWNVLPDEARIVAVPALAAAMLLDTFLYNEFLIRTGGWIWLEIYAFIYAQAVVVAAVARLLRPYWTESVVES